MGSIRSGVGLISGIDTNSLVKQLIALQRAPIARLEERSKGLQAVNTALKALEANLLTLSTSLQSLGDESNFTRYNVSNSDPAQLTATADSEATPGTYYFQTLRRASTFQALSRGFVNADQQAIGAGTITIQPGGVLVDPTRLDALNGGRGVQRGVIRITDRAGNVADVDLRNAFTVDDVLSAINAAAGVAVTASTAGGHLVLSDASGGSGELSVADVGGTTTASELGIAKSAAGNTLAGDDVYVLTGDFTLDAINDGNGIRRLKGAPDVRITTADGSAIDVNLDGAFNLNDVLAAINDHADNAGKVTASLVDGRLQIVDNTTGAGTFQIDDVNGTSVVEALGLDGTASGNTIAGRRLLAGIDSVLLANLRGGDGIDNAGQISLTDRSGASATIDLTGAESLDEVLAGINAAGLQLAARVNAAGTGIEIVDTSGSTAGNLIIADVGEGTLAAQLGIAADVDSNVVDGGPLNLRYLNESSSLEHYAPDGRGIEAGKIHIVDSAGNEDTIDISTAVKNIGDVLQRINASSGIQVRAELNDTGDGFVLIDEAGGSGTLKVEDVDADTAADLRILGEGVAGDDGRQRISSRVAAVIDVQAGDTLNDVVARINETAPFVKASVFNDGSAFNANRLQLTSSNSGFDGRLLVDDSGLDLGLSVISQGRDALLRIGEDAAGGFLVASPDGSFPDAVTGVDVQALNPGAVPARVTVSPDDGKIEEALQQFVKGYNAFVSAAAEQTKYDPETKERGVLQGEGIVLRAQARLSNLVVRRLNGFGTIASLADLGIRSGADGKLEFDKDKFEQALQTNRKDVEDFFRTEETGFSAIAGEVLKSLTDPIDGSFALEEDSLQQSVDALSRRIDQLDALLQVHQERLLRRFSVMENTLGKLTSQQDAIASLAPLHVDSVGRGIL